MVFPVLFGIFYPYNHGKKNSEHREWLQKSHVILSILSTGLRIRFESEAKDILQMAYRVLLFAVITATDGGAKLADKLYNKQRLKVRYVEEIFQYTYKKPDQNS